MLLGIFRHEGKVSPFVQGFAKSLLDVADNLERAAGAVPAEAVAQDTQLSVHEVVKHLRTLLEGVQLTDKQLKAVGTNLSCSTTLSYTKTYCIEDVVFSINFVAIESVECVANSHRCDWGCRRSNPMECPSMMHLARNSIPICTAHFLKFRIPPSRLAQLVLSPRLVWHL